MTRTDSHINSPLSVTIDDIIAVHGARRVLLAALRALFRPESVARPPALDELDDRIRRDIGLPAKGPPRHLPTGLALRL